MEFLGTQINAPSSACSDRMLCHAMVLGVRKTVAEGTEPLVMSDVLDSSVPEFSRCGTGCTIIAAQLALKHYE